MEVVIIGGGNYGGAIVRAIVNAGHDAVLIEQDVEQCKTLSETFVGCSVRVIPGKGFVASVGRVMVLNPETGDERLPVNFSHLVVATGALAEGDSGGRFIGLSKLGGLYDGKGRIIVESDGSTGVTGIYAAGGCATLDDKCADDVAGAILGAIVSSVGVVV